MNVTAFAKVCMFCTIFKFTKFRNCLGQIRNYVITNQFWNRNLILKFVYKRTRDHVQEAQASIVSDSVLERSRSKWKKWFPKIRDRKLCNCSRSTPLLAVQVLDKSKCVSTHQLFSPWPKGCALPPSQKKQVVGTFLHYFKIAQRWLRNFEIG